MFLYKMQGELKMGGMAETVKTIETIITSKPSREKKKGREIFAGMNTENMNGSIYLLLVIMILFTGCYLSWEPSDQEAISLVESYYLFHRGGKEVDAEIISRGKYDKKCKCYPIKFRIIVPEQRSFEKTFYFFKNETGTVEVREFKFGLR
jgi:hypothetical protein